MPPSSESLTLLKKHLQAIVRLRNAMENPENLAEVQDYILKTFQSYGYEVKEDKFLYEGKEFSNLIASWPGNAEIPELIIAAHFDAMPGTPGADDNASGVVAMLEVARLAALAKCRRNVHFLAFNLEEYGMIGSQAYVSQRKELLKRAYHEKRFQGMLSLEMVGYTSQEKGSQKIPGPLKAFYPDIGNFLALVGDTKSELLLKNCHNLLKSKELHVEHLKVHMKGNIFPEVRRSDHSSFWDEGLPALLVTDTSFFRNPHYHLPSDTVETLDLDFLEKVAVAVAHFVVDL